MIRSAVAIVIAFGAPGATDALAETERAPVQVIVTGKACEPNHITIPAGTVTFEIINRGTRAVEWEILKGVMVVDERENIAPGFRQKLTTTLEPGEYEITCGLLTNPKGRLTVLNPQGGTSMPPRKPSAVELIGPVAEYKVWLAGELAAFDAKAAALAAAARAGDGAKTQSLAAETRVLFARIEPVAAAFAAPAARIRDRAVGLPRIDGEFANKPDAVAPLADALADNAADLRRRAAAVTLPADRLVDGAVTLIRRRADSFGSSAEIPDRAIVEANLDGAAKIVELLRPLTARADTALSERIDNSFAAAREALARHKDAPLDSLSDADRDALREALRSLAAELGALRTALGLT